MATRLKIDVGAIDEMTVTMRDALDRISQEQFFTKQVEAVVGHPKVEGAVRGFENTWNRHRKLLVENVGYLTDILGEVAGTFAALETDLARGLTSAGAGEAPSAPATSSSQSGAVGGAIPV